MKPPIFSCLTSRMAENGSLYGRFLFGPLPIDISLTVATVLRRSLLHSQPIFTIASAEIEGATHEYASLPGVQESALEILLNLGEIVLTSSNRNLLNPHFRTSFGSTDIFFAFIRVSGPCVVTAKDINWPKGIYCVKPDAYVATVSNNNTLAIRIKIVSSFNSGLGFRSKAIATLASVVSGKAISPLKKRRGFNQFKTITAHSKSSILNLEKFHVFNSLQSNRDLQFEHFLAMSSFVSSSSSSVNALDIKNQSYSQFIAPVLALTSWPKVFNDSNLSQNSTVLQRPKAKAQVIKPKLVLDETERVLWEKLSIAPWLSITLAKNKEAAKKKIKKLLAQKPTIAKKLNFSTLSSSSFNSSLIPQLDTSLNSHNQAAFFSNGNQNQMTSSPSGNSYVIRKEELVTKIISNSSDNNSIKDKASSQELLNLQNSNRVIFKAFPILALTSQKANPLSLIFSEKVKSEVPSTTKTFLLKTKEKTVVHPSSTSSIKDKVTDNYLEKPLEYKSLFNRLHSKKQETKFLLNQIKNFLRDKEQGFRSKVVNLPDIKTLNSSSASYVQSSVKEIEQSKQFLNENKVGVLNSKNSKPINSSLEPLFVKDQKSAEKSLNQNKPKQLLLHSSDNLALKKLKNNLNKWLAEKKQQSNLLSGPFFKSKSVELAVSSSAYPVEKVNFLIERDDEIAGYRHRIILEVWTNGSITPRQAIFDSIASVIKLIYSFREPLKKYS